MKNLRNYLMFFLLLSLSTTYSQTKEETKDWVKSKLEINLYNSLNNNSVDKVEVDECFCTIYYTSKTNMGILKNIMKISTEIKQVSANSWIVPISNNIQGVIFKEKRKRNIIVTKYFDKENTFPLFVREGESNLNLRLTKAIKHLSTFCQNGKNEAF